MTVWKLSPQYKKSAVEKMFFYKDGKIITIEQGFRWGTFTVESDERPLTDAELKNEDGYELGCLDNDECWEMWDMIDGCWLDIEAVRNVSDEELTEFEEAWEEDSFEGVENLGWSCDDTEYYYHGPLELTNEDTGDVFKGEPDDGAPTAPVEVMEVALAELEEAAEEFLEVTDWYPVTVNPARVGSYEIMSSTKANAWPFPTKATWDGKEWSTVVAQWRGLVKESK
jgi:hypothetical protein